MKLTEKDLKYYLGTGLKAISERTREVRTVTIWHHTYDLKTVGFNHLVCDGLMIERHIPLMLPLSAITEQLPDGSIPIVELAKIANIFGSNSLNYKIVGNTLIYGLDLNFQFGFNDDSLSFFDYNTREIQDIFVPRQLQLFEYLYANHFWLGDQSLFETGEIIDKRTVKTD